MAGIRLKRITVEQSPLIIGNGDVNINSTLASNSLTEAALILNGGISINNTSNGVSSTAGGCMTIGGGLGIMKSTFIGHNLTLDSVTGTLSVNGLTHKRLFLDSVLNDSFFISTNGVDKNLEISSSAMRINTTSVSTNSTTGALVINGGVSINSTESCVNSSNGGALTVAGGVAVGKDLDVGDSLAVGKEFSNTSAITVRYTGNDQIALLNSSGSSFSSINMEGNDLFILNNKRIVLKSDNGVDTVEDFVIDDNLNISNNALLISNTMGSDDASTGALVVNGGVLIRTTGEATSSTSGGSFSTLGGMSIAKKTFTGDSIAVDILNTTKVNKIVLYQSSGSLFETSSFSGFGSNNGSIQYNLSSASDAHVFNSLNSEVFRIKGTGELVLKGNTQSYSILPGGHSSNGISFKSNGSGLPSYHDFFTQDGSGTNDNTIRLYGKGIQSNVEDSDYLELGWNASKTSYVLSVSKSGVETFKNLIVTAKSTIFDYATLSANSSTGALVINGGGLSINNTINSFNVSSGGAMTVAGGVSIAKDTRIGGDLYLGNLYKFQINNELNVNEMSLSSLNSPSIKIYSTNGSISSANITLYSLNSGVNHEFVELSTDGTSGYKLVTDSSGTGQERFLKLASGSNDTQLILQTSGNIGINVHDPIYKLDVDGSFHATGVVVVSNTTESQNSTTASLVVGGGISIASTENALSLTQGGAMTIAGGASIGKSMFIGGQVSVLDTTYSSSTSAALMVNGGVTIYDSTNSFGREGGALTVMGGASITGDLWVLGAINGGADSDSTYYHLTILATDNSTNMSSGSLISLGGITIQTSKNAVNVSNGGALLVAGGTSIGQDFYVGGDNYFYGITNFRGNMDNTNIFNFTDRFNIKRFSIDRSVITSDLSICRYTTSGEFVEQVFTIENANGLFTFRNTSNSNSAQTGAVVALGGVSISCSTNSTSTSNGGAFTIAGGASIHKDLYVGGTVYLKSTTESTDTNTGTLIVEGGVGIEGNLNVGGNISVIGNLSVLGSTTTVDSSSLYINDNKVILNSGPDGLCDSGLLIKRYQTDNDADSGNVIADPLPYIFVLPSQIGLIGTQMKLPTNANIGADYYKGWWVRITSGFSSNQVRKIISYDGTTKIATLSSPWTSQNPSIGDNAYLYNKPNVGIMFDEQTNRFVFGATTQEASQGCITLTTPVPVYFASATIASTEVSQNASTGCLVVSGGIGVVNTTNATNISNGGAMTIAGGASIQKNLYVGGSLNVNGVDLTPRSGDLSQIYVDNVNNRTSFVDVEGFFFDVNTVWGVDIYITVRIRATRNLYANFHIRAVSKELSWEIIKTYVGDDTGIDFYMTNSGQLQYKSQNYPGFVSCTFRGRTVSNG